MERRAISTASRAVFVSILIGGAVASYRMVHSSARALDWPAGRDEVSSKKIPLCGRPNDSKIHIPPDWSSFSPHAIGQSYIDPVFGCSVKRLTNGSTEEVLADGAHLAFMNYYSTLSPINATDTLILIYSNNGAWRITDMDGKVVVVANRMPGMNNGHPVWDAFQGNVFYYALGSSLYKAILSGNSVKSMELQRFKEYKGIVSPDASDLSQDGDHIALVGQNANSTMDVFVWSLSKKTKTSTYTTACKLGDTITTTQQPGCVHKLLLTADNRLSIQFAGDGSGQEEGVRLWNGSELIHLQDATNHYDTGYDLNGNPIFIAVNNSRTLHTLKNACAGGWGLEIRQQNSLASAACLLDKEPAWHVSYRGGASQPWAAISFFDDRKPGPELFGDDKNVQEPSSSNWQLYEDEVLLARVGGEAVYRLAHARSRSAEDYWSQPHAAISRDGKYVAFTSNMGFPNGCSEKVHVKNECTDVYLIKVF